MPRRNTKGILNSCFSPVAGLRTGFAFEFKFYYLIIRLVGVCGDLPHVHERKSIEPYWSSVLEEETMNQ